MQNVSSWSQVSQGIMVASARGIVVEMQTDAVKRIEIFPV